MTVDHVKDIIVIRSGKCPHALALMRVLGVVGIGCPVCGYMLSPSDSVNEMTAPDATFRDMSVAELLEDKA